MEKKRTSKKQFTIYLKFLEKNRILLTGKLTPTNNPEDLDNLWKALVLELNSCGDGPTRDIPAWKKAFTEWKSNSRKKARENRPLSDLEAAVIALTGSGAVTGLDTKELGFNESDSEEVEERRVETVIEDAPGPSFQQKEPELEVQDAAKPKNKKRQTTGNLLCDTYMAAVNESGDKLQAIADAIHEVAESINRYCDIVEANNYIEIIHVPNDNSSI